MYEFLLVLHNGLRWVVLVLGLIVLLKAFQGWFTRRPWTRQDNLLGVAYMSAFDTQILIGLVLYFGVSPLTTQALDNRETMMTDRVTRFFAVEHITTMLLALVLVHAGRIAAKRAPDDTARHRRIALVLGAAFLLMLSSIPWPFQVYGRPWFRF